MTIEDESQTAEDEAITEQVEQPADDTSTEEIAPVVDASAEALKAVNEAVEDASKPRSARPIVPKAEETPEAKEAALKAAAEKTAQEDAEAAEKGRVRGPDGKFREMTAEEKAAKEAAAKKQPDAVNDPIGKEDNPANRRIRELVGTVKQQEELIKGHTVLFDAVRGTGASPEEFGQMLNYMTASKSNDPKILEAAYTVLQQELRSLSIRLGRPLAEVNLLSSADNADLVQEIRDGKLTTERAREIALMRETNKTRSAATKQQSEQETATREVQAVKTQAIKDLDALDAELRGKDGDEVFQAKYDRLLEPLKEAFAEIHPSKWVETYRRAYAKLVVAAPKAPPLPPPQKQQPMRPKQPAGAGSGGGPAKAPGSALEAINEALGM